MTPTDLPPCDIVMKGGVTSGVVYPRLVSRLAREYRFKNIGGTSAGAIAAAACAAAELGRQSGRRPNAFEDLDALPQRLGTRTKGRSRLLGLFQPTAESRPAFDLVVAIIGARSDNGISSAGVAALRLAGPMRLPFVLWILSTFALRTIAASSWPATFLAAAVSVLAAGGAAIAAWFLALRCRAPAADALGCIMFLAVVAGTVSAAFAFPMVRLAAPAWLLAAALAVAVSFGWGAVALVGSTLRAWRDNFYGLCSGRTTEHESEPGLTDWLHGYLNELAGLPVGRPLTFGDLWNKNPAEDGEPGDDRQINLQMVTTALCQRTPYSLPFRPGTQEWYFDPAEWARLFPPDVMTYLHNAAKAIAPGPVTLEGRLVCPLPRAAALPVIVAVRMSLSFPLLLSAIPLYAFDYTEKTRHQPAPLKRVWFSDGGIGSNLPLQFFDTLLPQHPTFAVNLKPAHPRFRIDDSKSAPDNHRAYLPFGNNAGRGRHWREPPPGILAFLGAIVDTMQVWRDDILFPYAGYRDRLVHISLQDDEGGLHLDMSAEQVSALAAAGAGAAQLLRDRFHPTRGDGWANHQEVRLISVLGNLEDLARQAGGPAAQATWHAAADRSRLSNEQRALAHRLLDELDAMASAIASSKERIADNLYRPAPVMKLGPNL